MQVVLESIASVQFLKCSVYRVESVAYSLLHSWSFCYYSVSVVFSLVFSCQWGSESIAFSVSSVSVAFIMCTVQWVILRLYSSVSAVFRALAVHQESVMFMSCSESTPWMSSAPAQFLNFNILSTTEGHLRTKYNVKLLFFKSTYLSMHNATPFDTYLFSVDTYQGNLLVSSRFSKRGS